MKKFYILNRICILIALFAFSYNANAQCKARQIVKGCKPKMKPYKYDSYEINEITFLDKAQKIEIEFTAFSDIQYKLVFCSSGFEEAVAVNIYDKNAKATKRNKLYDGSQGKGLWSFEPPKTGVYFIEYDVPAVKSDVVKEGCIIMMVGYQ